MQARRSPRSKVLCDFHKVSAQQYVAVRAVVEGSVCTVGVERRRRIEYVVDADLNGRPLEKTMPLRRISEGIGGKHVVINLGGNRDSVNGGCPSLRQELGSDRRIGFGPVILRVGGRPLLFI